MHPGADRTGAVTEASPRGQAALAGSTAVCAAGWAVPSGLAPLTEAKSPVLRKQPRDTEPLTRQTEGRSCSPRAISHPQTAGKLFN